MVASEQRCPGCGIALKVTREVLDACPVCGAALPVSKDDLERKAEIVRSAGFRSLDNELFQRVGTPTTWTLKEMINVSFTTILFTVFARFLLLVFLIPDPASLTFNPLLVIMLHLSMVILGIVPLVYIKTARMAYVKLGFTRLQVRGLLKAILFGVGAGLVLFMLDITDSLFQGVIFEATGWEAFGSSPLQHDFIAFIHASPWNKLGVFLPYGASQVMGTVFSMGVVVNGMCHHNETRVVNKKLAMAGQVKIILVSSSIVSLLSFMLTFDPSSLFYSFSSMIVLSTIFIRTRSIHALLVANLFFALIAFMIA